MEMESITLMLNLDHSAPTDSRPECEIVLKPMQKVDLLDNKDVSSLCGNDNHSYITTHSGEVYVGKNISETAAWQRCAEMESKAITFIDSGRNHHAGLTRHGRVCVWNDEEQKDASPTSSWPEILPLPHKVVQVSCGANHTICLTEGHRVCVWGSNSEGQLGLGRNAAAQYACPQFMDSLKGIPFIQVEAGGHHCLALTGSSAVFGWGRNSNGQLGFERKDRQLYPAQCREVRTKMISHISCGENHTAMLSKDGRVFSFGLRLWDSAGREVKEFPDGEIQSLSGKYVSSIKSGQKNIIAFIPSSDQIFIFGYGQREINLTDVKINDDCDPEIFQSKEVILFSPSNYACVSIYKENKGQGGNTSDKGLLCLDKLKISGSQDTTNEFMFLNQKIKVALSNLSSINGSFLSNDLLQHECSRISGHGMDMKPIVSFFEQVRENSVRNRSLLKNITKALRKTIPDLIGTAPAHVEVLRVYLILPFCHLMEDVSSLHEILISPFIRSMERLDSTCQKILDEWIKNLPFEIFRKYLSVFKSTINRLVVEFKFPGIPMSEKLTKNLQSCFWVVEKLHKINKGRKDQVPCDEFYIPELLWTIDIREDLTSSMRDNEKGHKTFRFCKFPFVYNLNSKHVLLKAHNELAMVNAFILHVKRILDSNDILKQAFFQNPVSNFHFEKATIDEKLSLAAFMKSMSQFCVNTVSVRRESIIEDTKLHIKGLKDMDILKVEQTVMFEGEDTFGHGVYQEYFRELFSKLLDPDFGLFYVEDESNMNWFRPLTQDKLQLIYFVGLMTGIALYHSKLVNLQLPLALYKKLLNIPLTFKDFEELKPNVAQRLRDNVLNGEDVEFLGLNFVECVVKDGKKVNVKLCNDGEKKTVTSENKYEYIDLKVEFLFNKSVEREFEKFRQGFEEGIDINLLRELKFEACELRAVIEGEDKIDISSLKQRAKYEGYFHQNHQVIVIFWKILTEFTVTERKSFIRFITGIGRVPQGGLSLTIRPHENTHFDARDQFPVVATCSNVVFLPNCTDPQRLKDHLLIAIESKGFTPLETALGKKTGTVD